MVGVGYLKYDFDTQFKLGRQGETILDNQLKPQEFIVEEVSRDMQRDGIDRFVYGCGERDCKNAESGLFRSV